MESRDLIMEFVWRKVNQVVVYEDRQNAKEIGLDIDECAEMHLPGDCPLCGAS